MDAVKGVSSAYFRWVFASDKGIACVEPAGVGTNLTLAFQEFNMLDGYASRWYGARDSYDRSINCGLGKRPGKSGGRHHDRDYQKQDDCCKHSAV
jgi:hypothetical protein